MTPDNTGRRWFVTEVAGPLGGKPSRLDPPREYGPWVDRHWGIAAYHLELLPREDAA